MKAPGSNGLGELIDLAAFLDRDPDDDPDPGPGGGSAATVTPLGRLDARAERREDVARAA